MQITGLKGSRLSAQQLRLWPLQKKSPAYQSLCAVLMKGWLDRDALRKILQRIVARHEILRTVFYLLPSTDTPVQVVTDGTACLWPVISLENLDAACQLVKLDELVTFLLK